MTNLTLHPVGTKLPINQELAGLVPMMVEAEQAALTRSIKDTQLDEPITLWRGEIIDGRCRQLACLTAGKPMFSRDKTEDYPTEAEARVFVKSVNTRRNLTHTQKVMTACKESLEPTSKSIKATAMSWSVSEVLVKNARYITKNYPQYVEPLFNGKAVNIIDSNGREVQTVKVSAVYAHVKRLDQVVVTTPEEHGWDANAYIVSQQGKDWYYSQTALISDISTKQLIAELANYKFPLE